MKKNRKTTKGTYWGMEATTTNKDWDFIPVPGNGGKTTNAEIPAEVFERELAEYLLGGAASA